jgi:hypothetical protein
MSEPLREATMDDRFSGRVIVPMVIEGGEVPSGPGFWLRRSA